MASSSPDAEHEPSSDEAATLMLRAAQGDMEAFEAIVDIYRQRIANYAYRMLEDDATAEDVAQQVFVQAWKARGRYRPSAKLITWLLHITRNLVLNEIRRRRRKPAQSLDAEDLPERFFATVQAERPDLQSEHRELSEAVERAFSELPENQRAALLLVRHEQLPYEEIAVILKTSVSAVKSLIFRARSELRIKLAKYLSQ